MEFGKKLGFLIEPNIRLASTYNYARIIESKINKNKGIIKIKKQVTHERKDKSKVLTTHVIGSEAEEADLEMFKSAFTHFSYLSYKHSALAQQIVAMHSNEMLIVIIHFEILFGANLENTTHMDGKKLTLGKLLSDQKDNEIKFFLVNLRIMRMLQ